MTDGASAAGDELDATLALRDLLSEVTARFAAIRKSSRARLVSRTRSE